MTAFNIYCDESCHLERDGQPVMVLGAVSCPKERAQEIAERLREIKEQHGVSRGLELKWSKVSASKKDLYLAVLDYFFDDDDLSFRALIVPDKSKLRHGEFNQTHDDFYFKMYFDMLKVLFEPSAEYDIYLDIKDTRSARKTQKLHDVLSNNIYDFKRKIIRRIQLVRSEHVQQIQLADLLIGGLSYANRNLSANAGKVAFIRRMQQRSGYTLKNTTLLRERKLNLFVWQAGEAAP